MATWTPVTKPNDTWDIQSVSLHRIVEAGGHRITEDGQRIIRIVERRDTAWTAETASNLIWTTEA